MNNTTIKKYNIAMNKENKKEGRNLEEINEKKILNFGDLSKNQSDRGINVS
jgi:hypothetical protein